MKQRLPAKRTTGWTSNLLAAAGDVLVPLLHLLLDLRL